MYASCLCLWFLLIPLVMVRIKVLFLVLNMIVLIALLHIFTIYLIFSQAGKLDRLDGPLVTQVQKVRNVAAPKANEDSQAAPRMLKLTLTDGVSSVNALEMETINHVGLLCLSVE